LGRPAARRRTARPWLWARSGTRPLPPGDVPALDMGPQGTVVHDEAAERLRNRLPVHPGELRLAEKPRLSALPSTCRVTMSTASRSSSIEPQRLALPSASCRPCRRTTPPCRAIRPAPTVASRCSRSPRCPGAAPGPRGCPWPTCPDPSCIWRDLSVRPRWSAIISAITSSTTLRVLEKGR